MDIYQRGCLWLVTSRGDVMADVVKWTFTRGDVVADDPPLVKRTFTRGDVVADDPLW
jgi:hypothetical protein